MKKLFAALFSLLVLVSFPKAAMAAGEATFSLTPQTASKSVNSSFTVEVKVDTAGTAVTTMKAYLTFDPTVLEVTSISTAGSVATIFTENDPDNTNGTVHITGAATGAGFDGSDGLLATINLKAKGSGTSTLTFTSDSRILSSDDDSDILDFANLENGSYTVTGGTSSGTGAGTETTEATGSALPDSGSYSNTVFLLTLATIMIGAGVWISNPYFFSPALRKRHQEKDILKKL